MTAKISPPRNSPPAAWRAKLIPRLIQPMRDVPNIHVRPAGGAEVIDLRHAILRAGLPRETAIFDGDDAPTTRHFVAERGGVVIGCVTLVLKESDGQPAWQLRGMAVDPSVQRRGVGKKMLSAVDAFVRASNVKRLWCNARTPAAAFYQRHGWTIGSEEFDIPTAGPHFRMTKSFAH
jgi:GNAT superfamily N-acetyltransferase